MTACLPRLPRLPRHTHCSPHRLTLVPAARHTAVQFAIPLGICLHVSACTCPRHTRCSPHHLSPPAGGHPPRQLPVCDVHGGGC